VWFSCTSLGGNWFLEGSKESRERLPRGVSAVGGVGKNRGEEDVVGGTPLN